MSSWGPPWIRASARLWELKGWGAHGLVGRPWLGKVQGFSFFSASSSLQVAPPLSLGMGGGSWLHKMTREKVPFKCTLMVKLGPWAGGVCNCAHWGSFYAKDNDMSLCSTPHKLCKMHDMNGVRKPSKFSRRASVVICIISHR